MDNELSISVISENSVTSKRAAVESIPEKGLQIAVNEAEEAVSPTVFKNEEESQCNGESPKKRVRTTK